MERSDKASKAWTEESRSGKESLTVRLSMIYRGRPQWQLKQEPELELGRWAAVGGAAGSGSGSSDCGPGCRWTSSRSWWWCGRS